MIFRLLDRKLHPHSTLPIWFWGFRNSPESLVRIHYWQIPGFLKLAKKKPKFARNFPPRIWTKKEQFSSYPTSAKSGQVNRCKILLPPHEKKRPSGDRNAWNIVLWIFLRFHAEKVQTMPWKRCKRLVDVWSDDLFRLKFSRSMVKCVG